MKARRMMEPVVPSISVSTTGPLGVMHLPRMWLKCILYASGRLPEAFRHGVGGMDEFFLTVIRGGM